MKFTYYGHSCFSVSVGGKTLLFDPFITPNELASNIDVDEIHADYIFVSHGHFDHITDLKRIAARTGAKVLGNWELYEWFTEAGTYPSVAGLVYIAAHMPDAGENEGDDGKRFPSDLGKSGAIKKTADGFTYIDPAQFHEYLAADLSDEQAAFMARSQVLNPAASFNAVITHAAWRTKPSWMLVAGNDRAINPKLERWYAERAGSRKIAVAPGASHAVYASRPALVAALIEEAASGAK